MFYHNIKRVKEIAAKIERHEQLLDNLKSGVISIELDGERYTPCAQEEDVQTFLAITLSGFYGDIKQALEAEIDKLKAELNEL